MVFLATVRVKLSLTSRNCKNCLVVRRSSTTFDHKELDLATKLRIEETWSTSINKNAAFDDGSLKESAYVCPMFPYPSGNLHLGHVRVYAISDAIARFQRLSGKNVLHPIGFDSFGLPAENAAFENKVDPAAWTQQNITRMRRQLKKLGCSFDWAREITTSDPSYYKFTQHLFLLLYKHGLVYRKKAWVNWDPIDQTVLADEQVDKNGKSWRSGAKVERKMLNQWFIRTTNFAESLKHGLESEDLAEWRDIVKLQRHWIGECDGAEFRFQFYLNGKQLFEENIWTKTPEHICRAEFIAVSDPCYFGVSENDVKFLTAINPFTNKSLPVCVVSKEELTYPAGCHLKLGLPSQDVEDAKYAQKYKIPFDTNYVHDNFDERLRICELAKIARIGGSLKSSTLRDWLISRQRRWGTPIPMVHCSSCGIVPAKFEDLPIELPRSDSTDDVTCPKCAQVAKRETDTMDTFVDSSWYFLRFIDPFNRTLPFDQDKVHNVMPVDVYIGGKEHATLHLYYARFVSHFLHSIGLVPCTEPFKRLLVQGMVMGQTYYTQKSKKVVRPAEVVENNGKLIDSNSGEAVVVKWEKMSKSKHNGVEPTDLFDKYGVDTTRLLLLGDVAPTSDRLWKAEGHEGILNFQERIWILVNSFVEARHTIDGGMEESKLSEVEESLSHVRNDYIKSITYNYNQTYQLSVAVTKMHGLVKLLKRYDKQTMALSMEFEKTLGGLLIMLAPMVPHFASELWFKYQSAPNRLQDASSGVSWDRPVLEQTWPQLDEKYLLDVIVKVNNAMKSKLSIPFEQFKKMTKEDALNMALSDSKVLNFLGGRDVLESEYSTYDSHSACLNLLIDHKATHKLIARS